MQSKSISLKVLLGSLTVAASLTTVSPVDAASFSGIFVADQTLDKIYWTEDLNRDGDANDPGEIAVYFDETNASGLANPTGNVFTMLQSKTHFQYYGDGNTDSVYRLFDKNHNGNALDAGEANIWFSAAANANSFPLLTPNGLAEDKKGAIYIVEADTVGTPNGDFVYRTVDLNNDGDANDLGEANVWLDLKALNSASSPFEIAFVDQVAFISDTAGGSPRVYRAEDSNNDNVIDPLTEANIFIDDTNPFGIGVFYFGFDSDNGSLYGLDLDTQSVFRLTDENNSGNIDLASEALEVWNPSVIPTGFAFGVGAFSLATGPKGELSITSNGTEANEDNVLRLIDLNSDGDYLDEDETIVYASRELNGFFPERPRVVEYGKTVPEPSSILGLLGLATAAIATSFKRKHQ